VDKK